MKLASSFAWLDYSEHDRRKALDLIELFRERDTRDELGLGTVRDALSDRLFPGTSTIQTRARYFLFIPWIYQRLESRKANAADVARLARRDEVRLIDALDEAGEKEGVIGIEARAKLKRLPSNVYWQGLGDWGIRLLDATQAEYHQFFSQFARKERGGSEEEEADDGRGRVLWHPGLPSPPADFPAKARFALRPADAQYLSERVLAKCSSTLLAYLVDHGQRTDVAFPWEHPQRASFPEVNRIELEHARLFSLGMLGAPLIYNLQLAQLQRNTDLEELYRNALAQWAVEVDESERDFRQWDRAAFWRLVRSENRRIPVPTQRFIDNWLDAIVSQSAKTLAQLGERDDIRGLIAGRERRLKGPLSRIANPDALRAWNGASGTAQASYRWFRVQAIVNDIAEGLGRA